MEDDRDSLDHSIVELWLKFKTACDKAESPLKFFSDDDIDIWTALTKHRAVQDKLDKQAVA